MGRTRLILTFVFSVLLLLLLAATNADADSGGVHVVRSGETLASIARNYGVSASAIARANGISNPDLIRVGQRLVIPGGGSSSGGTVAKPAARTYVVKAGDTLNAIARRFGVSAASLAAANGLSNPNNIRIGMTLRIPSGGGAVAGPAAPSGAGTRFVADLSAQHCWLYKNGKLIGDWVCSSGRKGARTMPGTFKVQSKLQRAWGSAWNFWMPYWLGIYWAGKTENGIHGLPYNPSNGRKTWAGMVGTPITFGCIMLDDVNAKKLWEVAYIGMPVIIQP
ncbi:MAG: LysM peptidoglycan-binding domain-containing protein [Anaerolineae bacterium]|nr:LysM peptidoglycan-binding domain-containing protein [Anaerolineae bacterium]